MVDLKFESTSFSGYSYGWYRTIAFSDLLIEMERWFPARFLTPVKKHIGKLSMPFADKDHLHIGCFEIKSVYLDDLPRFKGTEGEYTGVGYYIEVDYSDVLKELKEHEFISTPDRSITENRVV
jgi:hypothetical protein